LPYDRTNSFSINDDAAYSWVNFGTMRLYHQVSWSWYSPNGSFATIGGKIGPVGGPLVSVINIRGYPPANMPGNWKADIYVDGQLELTEEFQIRR
jgi:hypothetical protein